MTNNVFITGGSRGIGAAAVLAFARAGYNVAFTYNSHPDAADAVRRQAEEINPGGRYLAIRADAGDPAQVRPPLPGPSRNSAVCRCSSAMPASRRSSCSPTPPTRTGGG